MSVEERSKIELDERLDELCGRRILNRQVRMQEVDALIHRYVEMTGSKPSPAKLQKLTDYILWEELSDPHPDKVTREAYPILSEGQLQLRYRKEASLIWAEAIGADRRSHRRPVRQHRTRTYKEAGDV